MPDEEYYAVVNDNPLFSEEQVTFCRDEGGDTHLHRDKSKALEIRDTLRKEYDNPDINVYRLTVHQGHIRDEYEQLEHDVNRCDDCDENHLCSDHAARRRDL